MFGRRLSLSSKVWIGFSAGLLLAILALFLSSVVGGDDKAMSGLHKELQKEGEPFDQCLARVRDENPSYTEELVERLCSGR